MRAVTITSFLSATLMLFGPSTVGAQTDFQWRGTLPAGQTLEIMGLNGDIHASASSSGEAEVTATKSARFSDPAAVRIEVVPHAGGVTICAVYPDADGQAPNRCEPGAGSRPHGKNDTVVRFDVHVPAGVRFVGRTVNGGVDGESLDADAEAHTVNGSVRLSTQGSAVATTVNGSLTLVMGRASWPDGTRFSTVNGGIRLSLPEALNVNLHASTVNGTITSEFPIVMTGTISRRRLQGTIGAGGDELALSTVNGSIELLKRR